MGTTYRFKSIEDKLSQRIPQLLSCLNIEVQDFGNRYAGCCPVHRGDNPTAFSLFKDSNKWCCFTHSCQQDFHNDLIGLIKGILPSHQLYEAINWAEKFLDNEVIPTGNLNTNIINNISVQAKPVPREQVRKSLDIPAQYYIDRGYSREVLDKYDVGLCINNKKNMRQRVVVPVYEEEMIGMIGCTGRSIFEKCEKCKCHHHIRYPCPLPEYRGYYSKWKHSRGFSTKRHLYNLWEARKYIDKTGVIILVESPGNVWRLEEAGIHNSVGLFGSSLSSSQFYNINETGALTIVVLADNDSGGKNFISSVMRLASNIYNIILPEFPKNDVGELSISEVKEIVQPVVEKYQL